MFAKVTDCETETPATPKSFCEQVKRYFEHFREVGATNLQFVKISDNRARTMTLWPDEETAHFAIDAIVEVGNSIEGVSVVASKKGPILA